MKEIKIKEIEKLKEIRIKEEFFKFMQTFGVVGVAVGIVMGQAIAKFITAVVEGLVMPLIEVVLPGNKWQEAAINLGMAKIKVGLIIAASIDLVVVSAVIFLLVRYILKIGEPTRKTENIQEKGD